MTTPQEARAKLNTDVKVWSETTRKDLRSALSRLNVRETGQLMKSISTRLNYDFGNVSRVRFRFPRYGIFLEKGAGRGKGGLKGSTWTNAKGVKKTTNPASKGKMNTGMRKAKEWFNPTIGSDIKVLEEILVRDYGDLIEANFSHLKIK